MPNLMHIFRYLHVYENHQQLGLYLQPVLNLIESHQIIW